MNIRSMLYIRHSEQSLLRIRFTYGKLHLGHVICRKLLLGQCAQTYGSEQQIVIFIKLPSPIAQIYWSQM
jgi:hypothetical protein